jgi:hypothetical protein
VFDAGVIVVESPEGFGFCFPVGTAAKNLGNALKAIGVGIYPEAVRRDLCRNALIETRYWRIFLPGKDTIHAGDTWNT